MRYTVDFYRKLLVLVSAGNITSSHFQGIADKLPETKSNGGAVKSILPRIERALSGEFRESDKKRVATMYRIRQAHYALGGRKLAPTNNFNAAVENTRSRYFNFEEYTGDYDTEQKLSTLKSLGHAEEREEEVFSDLLKVGNYGIPIVNLSDLKPNGRNLFSRIIKYIKSIFSTEQK
jgi:hypothetical protein